MLPELETTLSRIRVLRPFAALVLIATLPVFSCAGGSGGGDGDFEDRCLETCDFIEGCFLGVFDRDTCEDDCEDRADIRDDADDASCNEAQDDYLDCLLGSECADVIAAPVCTDELMDINDECEIGGGGGPSGDLGELTLSGADVTAGNVPDDYDPVAVSDVPIPALDQIVVVWAAGSSASVTLTVKGDAVGRIMYSVVTPGALDPYFYQIDCDPAGTVDPGCSDVSVDVDDESLTFDDASIPVSPWLPDNEATDPLTVDGTITW